MRTENPGSSNVYSQSVVLQTPAKQQSNGILALFSYLQFRTMHLHRALWLLDRIHDRALAWLSALMRCVLVSE